MLIVLFDECVNCSWGCVENVDFMFFDECLEVIFGWEVGSIFVYENFGVC